MVVRMLEIAFVFAACGRRVAELRREDAGARDVEGNGGSDTGR